MKKPTTYAVHVVRSLIFFLIAFSSINPAHAIPPGFDATKGTWLISGRDSAGTAWDGSTIHFESQTADGNDLTVKGYFNWVGSNGSYGRENFTGTLYADGNIHLTGFEIVQPASSLALGDYVAVLDATGTQLNNGAWGGSGIPSNDWSADLLPDKPQISVNGGFIKLDTTNGYYPNNQDCIAATHYGRMVFDEVNNTLYACGKSGWVSINAN
ncbi:MAG: hypothetical protein MI754_18895 [Chromatiales bacterium]|nr:hypothetical protein [Chromatiales bacterium]